MELHQLRYGKTWVATIIASQAKHWMREANGTRFSRDPKTCWKAGMLRDVKKSHGCAPLLYFHLLKKGLKKQASWKLWPDHDASNLSADRRNVAPICLPLISENNILKHPQAKGLHCDRAMLSLISPRIWNHCADLDGCDWIFCDKEPSNLVLDIQDPPNNIRLLRQLYSFSILFGLRSSKGENLVLLLLAMVRQMFTGYNLSGNTTGSKENLTCSDDEAHG